MECKNRVNCPICHSDESNYITKKTCVLPLLYKELRQCKKCNYDSTAEIGYFPLISDIAKIFE